MGNAGIAPRDLRLHELLSTTAMNESVVTYEVAARHCGLELNIPDERMELFAKLERIARAEHAAGNPLLTVVVIGTATQFPVPSFFNLARQLGRHYGSGGSDEVAFFTAELNKVYAHWAPAPAKVEKSSRGRS